MNKEQIDELCHILRCASNEKRDDLQIFPTQHLILGLARHLLAGGDYEALVQFSAYYGERFLLQLTYEAIHKKGWKPLRIVELGAGLGWMGRGLAAKLGFLPALFTDKRQWAMIDVVADLETENGRTKVLTALKEGDLLVMSDLLHCLDNPKEVMSYFSRWPAAILEYCPTNTNYAESYSTQITRYGATPIMPEEFEDMFPGRKVDIADLDPYCLFLVDKEEQ